MKTWKDCAIEDREAIILMLLEKADNCAIHVDAANEYNLFEAKRLNMSTTFSYRSAAAHLGHEIPLQYLPDYSWTECPEKFKQSCVFGLIEYLKRWKEEEADAYLWDFSETVIYAYNRVEAIIAALVELYPKIQETKPWLRLSDYSLDK